MSNAKTYTLFAGVNGAGKSTFFKSLDIDFGTRINVDEIVRDQFSHDWQSSVLPMCDRVQIYDNSGLDPFDILSPLLIVIDGKEVKWNEVHCPQYLKDILQDYRTWLK